MISRGSLPVTAAGRWYRSSGCRASGYRRRSGPCASERCLLESRDGDSWTARLACSQAVSLACQGHAAGRRALAGRPARLEPCCLSITGTLRRASCTEVPHRHIRLVFFRLPRRLCLCHHGPGREAVGGSTGSGGCRCCQTPSAALRRISSGLTDSPASSRRSGGVRRQLNNQGAQHVVWRDGSDSMGRVPT